MLARIRRASRFATASAFASYAGVAPLGSPAQTEHGTPTAARRRPTAQPQAAHRRAHRRADARQHRTGPLRHGDRSSQDPHEAMRCLKRRLADYLWRPMIADERRHAADPEGHPGATLQSGSASSTRPPALRTSHCSGPPTATLRRLGRQLDHHRGTPGRSTPTMAIRSGEQLTAVGATSNSRRLGFSTSWS